MSFRVAAITMGLLVAAMPAVMPAAAKDPSPNPAPNAAAKAGAATPQASTPKSVTPKASANTPKASAKAKDDPDSAVEQIARPSATQLAAMGWRIIDDPATGSRLGLPSVLVPKIAQARMGSRWTSAHGQIDVETFRLHEAALAALFDDEKKNRHRAVEHSALKPDSFVISGMQGLKRFVERVQASGSELRGITIMFDQATENMMAPVAAAMADTFQGFPDPNAGPPPGLRRSVDYGTGVVVSDRGYLLTAAPVVDQCQSITVSGFGHAERIAVDDNGDLALLRLYGAQNLSPAAIAGNAASTDNLTLAGIADPLAQAGDAAVTHAQARLTPQGLDPVPKLGFSGAAVVDPQGHFAGIVSLKWPLVASSGTTAPTITGQAALIPADTIRSFLAAQGVTPSTSRAPIDQSVLRVICVRK
jgi:S1-C subfamily serine protease